MECGPSKVPFHEFYWEKEGKREEEFEGLEVLCICFFGLGWWCGKVGVNSQLGKKDRPERGMASGPRGGPCLFSSSDAGGSMVLKGTRDIL